MRVRELALTGVFLVDPQVFRDSRVCFVGMYREQKFRDSGLTAKFVPRYTA